MRFMHRISLSSAPFFASLVVITSLTVFIGIFWSINEYQAYQESIGNIRLNYKKQYEGRLSEELTKVVELIDYRRLQNDLRVERDLRERVQSAYTIASHNFRLYKDRKSLDEIRAMVTELLRPIRWNDGRGYYFIGRVKDRRVELFADEPFFEEKSGEEFFYLTGKDMVGELSAIVLEKEAGLYRYNLVKPEFPGRYFPKIAFVKYFRPLDWFIGAGIYVDDLEERLQQEVLERIANISFGRDGEVFCFRRDGTILNSGDKRLVGRSAQDLSDANGQHYGQELLERALTGNHSGYVNYSLQRGESPPVQKLGFVSLYPAWGWVLGASLYMDDMERAVAAETTTYQRISFKNVFAFIFLFAVAVAFLLLSTFYFSLKIKQGIRLFTDFFRQAADTNVKIVDEDLVFREFEDLGRLANTMVEERIKNEQLLHRDELRLDTLLRLGMMDKYSLEEKYSFILQRIIQITRSRSGYLALVDPTQSHLTLCAAVHDGEQVVLDDLLRAPRLLEASGLPGHAVQKKTPQIVNLAADVGDVVYPYSLRPERHLDVPIYNDGRIVLVAGVCGNKELYDNTDIRQMTMLLEGLWLHVLKKCSEEELARLERHIIAVSEEERSKIGRDLHDDLGSHLSGVELLSKALQRKLEEDAPAHASQLELIRNYIREAIEKTRQLSQGLYPVHVVEYGLESAIEELVAEVTKMFQVNFDLQWEGSGREFGKNTSTHLHYIIREAVFNAARHGKPKNIGVYVRLRPEGFLVKIVDDGVGLNDTPIGSGMGFHTMKYRAKAIGASLNITSGKGGGTVITVSGEEGE